MHMAGEPSHQADGRPRDTRQEIAPPGVQSAPSQPRYALRLLVKGALDGDRLRSDDGIDYDTLMRSKSKMAATFAPEP